MNTVREDRSRVIVGSLNPVKIICARKAFKRVWPENTWFVEGAAAQSSVSNQPMSDEETLRGATNRAEWCLKHTQADFGVGIEGGIQLIGSRYFGCGWVVVKRRSDGAIGMGSSARVEIAPALMELIQKGEELGIAADALFNTTNVKQSEGHFGLMTNGLITRTSGYIDGTIFALSRFLQPQLF